MFDVNTARYLYGSMVKKNHLYFLSVVDLVYRFVYMLMQTVIARRSDMLVMSSDGPLGAYVNPYGYVHEIMTFYKANDIALTGRPVKKDSWFPGYELLFINVLSSMIYI